MSQTGLHIAELVKFALRSDIIAKQLPFQNHDIERHISDIKRHDFVFTAQITMNVIDGAIR